MPVWSLWSLVSPSARYLSARSWSLDSFSVCLDLLLLLLCTWANLGARTLDMQDRNSPPGDQFGEECWFSWAPFLGYGQC